MNGFVGLIVGLVVTALVLFMIARYASLHNKKEVNATSSVNLADKNRQKRQNWILPIILAIIIAIKTVVGGVFFLVIVWLMRLDPKSYSKTSPYPSDADKKTAKRIYTWLLLSPFITVPVFLIMVAIFYDSSSTEEMVLTALAPLLFHTVLLFGLRSKSFIVFRHTQQAIFLTALRAGMAALAVNIGSYPEDGLGLFLLGNGSLWLFGFIWGRRQVVRGECWWSKQKGETIALKVEADVEYEMTELASELKRTQNLSPQDHIKLSDLYLVRQRKGQAKEHAFAAFRLGNEKIKKQAIEILDELGEVETF